MHFAVIFAGRSGSGGVSLGFGVDSRAIVLHRRNRHNYPPSDVRLDSSNAYPMQALELVLPTQHVKLHMHSAMFDKDTSMGIISVIVLSSKRPYLDPVSVFLLGIPTYKIPVNACS